MQYDEKPIADFPGYHARADGEIISRKKPGVERVLAKTRLMRDGWARVTVQRPTGTSPVASCCQTVASLMASAFHGRRPTPDHVAHYINDDPTDDRAENIEWIHPRDLMTKRLGKALQSPDADALAVSLMDVFGAIRHGTPIEQIARESGLSPRLVHTFRSCVLGLLMKRGGRKARRATEHQGDKVAAVGVGGGNS